MLSKCGEGEKKIKILLIYFFFPIKKTKVTMTYKKRIINWFKLKAFFFFPTCKYKFDVSVINSNLLKFINNLKPAAADVHIEDISSSAIPGEESHETLILISPCGTTCTVTFFLSLDRNILWKKTMIQSITVSVLTLRDLVTDKWLIVIGVNCFD